MTLEQASTEQRPRILIVEDDFFVALDLEAGLTDAGMTVIGPARTAEEAVALARAERPALAVMDIRLASTRDGIDAALDLYRDLGIRSLFASAHTDSTFRTRAAPAKPLGWLQKPYTIDAMVGSVRKAIAELESEH